MATVTRADPASAARQEAGLCKRDAAETVDAVITTICGRLPAGDGRVLCPFRPGEQQRRKGKCRRRSGRSHAMPMPVAPTLPTSHLQPPAALPSDGLGPSSAL